MNVFGVCVEKEKDSSHVCIPAAPRKTGGSVLACPREGIQQSHSARARASERKRERER